MTASHRNGANARNERDSTGTNAHTTCCLLRGLTPTTNRTSDRSAPATLRKMTQPSAALGLVPPGTSLIQTMLALQTIKKKTREIMKYRWARRVHAGGRLAVLAAARTVSRSSLGPAARSAATGRCPAGGAPHSAQT